ncbi:MAG: hypothetical protein ABIP07_02970 [Sphingomicrobium sp.]
MRVSMPDQTRNGIIRSRFHGPTHSDPHCQSALLLVESLIHALIDKSVLTLPEAIEIIDVAEDVELEMARMANGAMLPQNGESLLGPIAKSLRADLGARSTGPQATAILPTSEK